MISSLRQAIDSMPAPDGPRHPDAGAYFLAAYYTVADRFRNLYGAEISLEQLRQPMFLGEALEELGNGPSVGNCGACGKGPQEGGDGTTSVKKCGGCGPSGVWYCGPECQRADWRKRHKFLCERRKAA